MSKGRRRGAIAAVVLLLLTGTVVGALIVGTRPHAPPLTPAQLALRAEQARIHRELAAETKTADRGKSLLAVTLPRREGAAAPVGAGPLFKAPLARHQVLGFVRYWDIGTLDNADFADASELVYSSVCVSATGAFLETEGDCANGIADLSTSTFVNFVTAAHAAHDRVLLSISTADDNVISRLDAAAKSTSAILATGIASLVSSDHLDGVNIDIEGTKASEQPGFVVFIGDLTKHLRALDPAGQILLDTFASSAGAVGFFNVDRLARDVDALFIECYDMASSSVASANAPLQSPDLSYSDVQTLMQYERYVKPSKLILGDAFYGVDFKTASSRPGSTTTSAVTEADDDAAILAAGHRALWDTRSDTPFSVYSLGGTWHQIFYDDPVSIALKTALASALHLAGVGAWAFGMEGGDSAMVAALDGGAAPLKYSINASPAAK